MILPGNNRAALRNINRQNRKFWAKQNKLRDMRMSDEAIFEIATNDMRSETARWIPVKSQKSFEGALADAALAKRIVHTDFSRKGRKARKADALQTLILKFVREDLKITCQQLFYKLRSERGPGIAVSIDRESDFPPGHILRIHFVDRYGTPRTAPVRGLKDRLSRARKKIHSLQPASARQRSAPRLLTRDL